jgi:hypothetical protein
MESPPSEFVAAPLNANLLLGKVLTVNHGLKLVFTQEGFTHVEQFLAFVCDNTFCPLGLRGPFLF